MIHPAQRAMVYTSAAIACFATGLLAPAAAFAQSGVLDQTSPATNTFFNYDTTTLVWQQQIKAGIAGKLEGITVVFNGIMGGSFTLRVRLGPAPSTQPVLFQTSVVDTMGMVTESQFVDMTAANIILAVDSLYVMEIQGEGYSLSGHGSYVAPPGQPLYPEPLYRNGSPYADGGYRLAFSTYMVVPCPLGMACDDNDLCTTGDTCNAGDVCAGMPVVCSPADACHVGGACDPATGMCSNPAAPDDTACDDADACTQVDTCQAGVCSGASPVTCPPADACQDAGVCNPQSGLCEATPKPDGTPCPGGTCMAGVCQDSTTSASSSSSGAGASGSGSGGAGASGSGSGGAGASGSSSGGAGASGSGSGGAGASGSGGGGAGASGSGSGGAGASGSGSGGAGASGTGSGGAGTSGTGDGGGGNDGGSVNQVGGCGCRVAEAPKSGAPLALFAGLALAAARRRRSR